MTHSMDTSWRRAIPALLVIAALFTVFFATNSRVLADQGPFLYAANGHYYEAVTAPAGGLTWDQAKVAAAGREHLGLPGHLVTLTSGPETDFVVASLPEIFGGGADEYYWIGAEQPAVAGCDVVIPPSGLSCRG